MLKDSFLKYLLLERNYSEKTILSYGIDLDEFEAYFKGVDVELEFTSVDADVVRGWVLSLMDEGRAETTVNRKLSSLRSFYHYLLRQKLVAVDPVAKVVGPKKKKPLPVFVRDEAMSQLLDGFEFPQTFEGVREVSEDFKHIFKSMTASLDQTEQAVTTITDNTISQADHTVDMKEKIDAISRTIDKIAENVSMLAKSAEHMKESNKAAEAIMEELVNISKESGVAIENVRQQTDLTNQSAQEIRRVCIILE